MADGVITAAKQGQRAMWAAGAWDEAAELVAGVGPKLLDRVGIGPGMDVLDVATGSGGNGAIPAAQRGANVIGLDLTPELLEHARRRGAAAGVDVSWVEGDAEALPFDDDRFDRVISTFGHICAPRHAVATAELARVCRPDGVIAFTSWRPDSAPARMFTLVGSYMPPLPDEIDDLVKWGDERHVRSLLESHGLRVEFARDTAPAEFESVDAAVAFYEQKSGGLVFARTLLEPRGLWGDLRSELRTMIARSAVTDGPPIRIEPEYLTTVAAWSGEPRRGDRSGGWRGGAG